MSRKNWFTRALSFKRESRGVDVGKKNRESPQLQKVDAAREALLELRRRDLSIGRRIELLSDIAVKKRDLLVIPAHLKDTGLKLPEGVGIIYVDTPVPAIVRT